MKLYEISQEYLAVLEMAQNEDIDADAIRDTLEGIQGEFEGKVDNTACVIKQINAEAEAIKAEADKLLTRAKTRKAKADRMKLFLQEQMNAVGIKKVETTRNVVSVQKSPEAVRIANEEAFLGWAVMEHEEYIKQRPQEPDKTKIKEALRSGAEIPGVSLQSGESVRIR